MKYFTFQEFERSETAYRHAIDNSVPEAAKAGIAALVDSVLDPLREAWGRPITVTSGYRCPRLNKAVGGVATSQHTKGEAADISVGNPLDNRRLAQKLLDLKLPFDQIINEHDWQWVHVSYRADKPNRHEILKTVPGGYIKINAI